MGFDRQDIASLLLGPLRRERGRNGEREGGTEGGREGGREGEREGEMEGEREGEKGCIMRVEKESGR